MAEDQIDYDYEDDDEDGWSGESGVPR